MPLTTGSRVGGYEIVGLIGAGGMGEVYRARDTKLKRDVAIKILPESFANDADRLARFQREAEVLATLNHPNIAAVYGLEDSGGIAAIVMELVEGDTLADRIAPSRVPVDEALAIARQIADALETAHERGIIHRDLKPANIKITPDGFVKVLDFGLAKMLETDGAGPGRSSGPGGLSMSPTLSVHATMQGVILGTAGYMSPEQARGKPVDRRTDIWAFGCVLFEMLAGRQVFDGGETVTDTIAAIIKNEPDWTALPADTPAHIRSLLRRCLQKDLKRRLPHIGVARIEIEEGASAQTSDSGVGASSVPQRASPATRILPWTIAGIAITVAAALGAVMMRHREPVDLGPVRFAIDAPEGATLGHNVAQRGTGSPAPHFAPSPDGRRLAYVMYTTDKPQLWLRRLDALNTQPLPGTEDAAFPFWSPDSRFIAFFAQGKLKKVDAAGGPPQTICDAPAGEGGTWNRDGVIVFAREETGALSRVSAAGGAASAVTTLDAAQGEVSHRWPQFLPDGRHFLFLAMSGSIRGNRLITGGAELEKTRVVYIGSLDSAQRILLVRGTIRSAYSSGYLLFMRESTLMAQALDVGSFHLSGEATPIVEEVAVNSGNGRAAFAVSESGMLVYRGGIGAGGQRKLVWVDRSGKPLGTVGTPGFHGGVRLSPDDKRLAVFERDASSSGAGDLWIFELARGEISTRFTLTPTESEAGFAWSPDGSRMAYAAGADESDLYQKATAGVAEAELLLKSPQAKRPMTWSPDSRYIAYNQVGDNKTRFDIWLMPTVGERKPAPFLRTEFSERDPAFSPDGRWIAFTSDKSGVDAVYVRPFPTGESEWRISPGDGSYAQWRADGKELFYVSLRSLMAVGVKPGAAPEFGAPVKLFEAPISPIGVGQYTVASDGQRFLLIEQQAIRGSGGLEPMTVVLNWTAALRK